MSVTPSKDKIIIASSVGRKAVVPINLGTITDGITLDQLGLGNTVQVKNGGISNVQIAASAGIVDTKLATIATAGKVSNSATTATNLNTINAIVCRDGSGNFSAGTITASLSGNASTSTALQTGRTINGTTFDGTANITVTAAAGTLTGTTLNSTVVASSLTSVGTLTNLTVTNAIVGSVTGSAGTVTTNANLTGVVTSVGNATSIASGVLSDAMLAISYLKADGSRSLTAEWDTGASFGVKAPYFLSRSTSTAGSGTVLLSHTDTVAWRNLANSADLSLKPNASSNILNFNSIDLIDASSTQTLTNKSLSGSSNTFSSIPNSATTATSSNVNSTIVSRDGSGASSFGSINANGVTVGSAANTISALSTIINTGTITLPTSTSTLATLALSETLTNKSLTSPTISGGTHTAITSLGLRDTSAAFDVTLAATSSTALTAARTLTIDTANTSPTLKLAANLTVTGTSSLNGTLSGTSSGTNTGDQTNITGNAATVTTNANLTGVVTSVGNATSIANGAITDAMHAVSYLKADGTRALTASWSAGNFSATHNGVVVGSAANTISALSTIINTGTLTLPTASDTLVGRATSDTLSGKTFSDAPAIQAGSSTGSALKLAGILYRSTATQQNTSTTETDLFTTTVLASTLSAAGNALIYKSNGSLANNAATKTLKLYFGSTSVTLFAVTTANTTWRIEVEVSRISSGSQRVTGIVFVGTAINQILDQTFSVTDSSDQTAKLTGTGSTGSGDFNAKFFSLGFERS